MARYIVCMCLVLLAARSFAADQKPRELFNGKDLAGWEGDPQVWNVEDGAIVGRTTTEKPLAENTFLVWKDGEVSDFRLRLEYRIEGGNSGVQYRSRVLDKEKWIVGGYQADIDSGTEYTGILYEERGRGILAKRGQRMKIDRDGKSQTTTFADAAELQKSIHSDDWNKYLVEAVGPRLRHIINGKLMSVTVDRDRKHRARSGVLALQVHKGPPMTVRFRNLRLEPLPRKSADAPPNGKQTNQ